MSGTPHVGPFEDFKRQDTVLFSGGAEAVTRFREVLQGLACLGSPLRAYPP